MGEKKRPSSASESSEQQSEPQCSTSHSSMGHKVSTPRVTWANVHQLDHQYRTVARSRSPLPNENTVEQERIRETAEGFEYDRSGDYPSHFPCDQHLYDKIKDEKFIGVHNAAMAQALERAILLGRNVLDGAASPSDPLFLPGEPRSWKFPIGIDAVQPADNKLTRAPLFTPAQWGTTDEIMTKEHTDYGLFLTPCKWGYRDEPLAFNCLAMRFRAGVSVGWFNDLNVRIPHVFRPGVAEFTDYVLEHYKLMLDRVGLYHSVYASRFHYPIFKGLCCGLLDVFLKEFNTFCTAEGETSLDLWSLHRISGLPIDGEPYEEVCLPDVLKDSTDGNGNYSFGYSYRYLMKVYRDLFYAKKDNKKRVRAIVWLQMFYYGDLKYDNFPTMGNVFSKRLRTGRNENDIPEFLKNEYHKGENPLQLDSTTHLAAYLTYWLCTFAVPHGDAILIRPDAIYPACQLAWGIRLAICPVTLCLIYKMLGQVCSHHTPRYSTTVGPIHFFSIWAATLFPSLVERNTMVSPNLFPKMLEYVGASMGNTSQQLHQVREALTEVPLQKSGSLTFWSLTANSRPSVNKYQEFHDGETETVAHHRTGKGLVRPKLSADLRAWALAIRPSVLVYRRGQTTVFEPYYPFRFARNFGYDQHIPSQSHVFILHRRSSALPGGIALARKWWDYYHRRDGSLFRVPGPSRHPRVTSEYVKWWQSRTCPYRNIKDECWLNAEKSFIKAQKVPPFDIDTDYLVRLLGFNGAVTYANRRQEYKSLHQSATPPYDPPLTKLDEREFIEQCLADFKVNAHRSDLIEEPFPQEEITAGKVNWWPENDPARPGFLSYDSSTDPGLYKNTTWPFVLVTNCMLQDDSGDEHILASPLPKSYWYADGWGIDHLNLYYCLAAREHHDLARLAKHAKTTNDVMYLVREGARRDKVNALEYWPISNSYSGPPEPKTKARYRLLVLEATRPVHFDEIEGKTPSGNSSTLKRSPKLRRSARLSGKPQKMMQVEPEDISKEKVKDEPKWASEEEAEEALPVGLKGAAPIVPSIAGEGGEEDMQQAPPHQLGTTAASAVIGPPPRDTTLEVNWADVDRGVQVEVPSSPPLVVVECNAAYMEYLRALKRLVTMAPPLPYSVIKHQVDKATVGLHMVGHPLKEWVERATAVLRHVRRRDFVEELIAMQTSTLEQERAECKKHVHLLQAELAEQHQKVEDLLQRQKLVAEQVENLEQRLARAKDGQEVGRRELTVQQQSLTSTQSQLASIATRLSELDGKESQLTVLRYSSSSSLSSLDELFKGVE